jgi:alkanesulfonate monooxygenase SsuD/methylene tetrahydromethanopterin reductase-like flavin-dependent oxidoreductase (luciferase family)
MAAVSPSSYEYAAKFGISLLRSPQFTNLGTVAEAFEEYRKLMSDQGFDADAIDQPFSVRTFVAPTDEEAKAETKHVVWFYHLLAKLLPGAPGLPPPPTGYENYPRDPSALSKITTDDVWERGTAFGSPDRVIAQMKRYMHEAGATSFLHQMRIGGLEHDKVMRSMELYAKHVMPALKEEEAKMRGAVPV